MSASSDFPVLDSPAKCAALWTKYPEKVVGMWATGLPRQNVDVLWRLRQELLMRDVPVVFFFKESARTMLKRVITGDTQLHRPLPILTHSNRGNNIYQLDDAKLFRLLDFVEVLVSNDYCLGWHQARHIGAKLVGLPHHAKIANPCFSNNYYDYFITDVNKLSNFDYNIFPYNIKLHRNSHFTQLLAGHPKIDLIIEERQNNIYFISHPLLLIYLSYIDVGIELQKINYFIYEEIWSDIISSFLRYNNSGIMVIRPPTRDISHQCIEHIYSKFVDDGRLFIDAQGDNKFWLSRATHFITDYFKGFINFCMTAKRPAIRMMYTQVGEEPRRDEWGRRISRPNQFLPLLEEMDKEEVHWTEMLLEKQKCEMPTLGKNFALLGEMIKRIFNNDDDPAWLKVDKGHTSCEKRADMLKLVAKCTKQTPYPLRALSQWLSDILVATSVQIDTKIWLLFLKRALLTDCDRDSMKDIEQLFYKVDSPASISKYIGLYMDKTINNSPLTQLVGLLRHLVRRYPQKITTSLLLTTTSNAVCASYKKRALFFLLMELSRYDPEVLREINRLAEAMPQDFSQPVLAKLNRFLPLAMKVPLPLRRAAARILGVKKTLAKKYWQAHCALS